MHGRRDAGLSMVLICLLLIVAAVSAAQPKVLVTFNREDAPTGRLRGNPPWDAGEYGLERRNFGKSTLQDGFVDALGQARMLVVARDAAEQAEKYLFGVPAYQAAIRDFLTRGGVLMFQYHGLPDGQGMRAYLKSLGVVHPGATEGKYYTLEIPAGTDHRIVRSPHKLKSREGTKAAYGWWSNRPAGQTALFSVRGDPDKAAMLVQDGVQGKGTVIFSRIFVLGRSKNIGQNPYYRGLMENLLTCAFGPLTKGAVIPISASAGTVAAGAGGPRPKAPEPRKANRYYFRNLLKKPWWNSKWPFRVPVVVFEPIGLERYQAPVSVVRDYPAGTQPASLRVVTPWGEELPSQAHRVGSTGNRIEVVFVHDLLPHEHVPLFIYYGNNAAGPAVYETDLLLKQRDRHFALWNDKLQVEIRRRHPLVTRLQPRGNPTGNQLRNHAGLYLEGSANAFYGTKASLKTVTVKEHGPIRTVIAYEGEIAGKKGSVTYTLYSGSGRLNYAFQTEGKTSIRRRTGWLPGKALENADRVYFATDAGFKGLKVSDTGPFAKDLTKQMTEGWYAFQDTDTGQACGELFERARNAKIDVYIHGGMGYLCTVSSSLSASPLHGAFVPSAGPFTKVRDEYVLWKSPPEVLTAEPQKMTGVRPKVPVFGRDFIQTESINFHWTIKVGNSGPRPLAGVIPGLTRALQRLGANYVALTTYEPFWKSKWARGEQAEFMDALLAHAHANGMGVMTWLNNAGSSRFHKGEKLKGDKITLRKYYVEAARELGRTDLDMVLLLDEDGYWMGSAESKALFRKKYGMEPAKKATLETLAEPAVHNRAFFETDVYTDCIREMAAAIRENNPRMIVSDQVNPSHLTHCFNGYHDYEKHAEFLSTICMDLYGGARQEHEYYMKYMKGAFGNDTPIILYSGCTSSSRLSRQNHYGLLMWGPDLFFHWTPGPLYETVTWDTLKKVRYHLDYTGLGDLVTRAAPVRSVAVLRDRAGFEASLKRGEWGTYGSTYEKRIRNVTYVKNLLSDIVFSRYFTAEKLKDYALLVLVDSPVVTDKTAGVLESYLKAGGKVIMEGECIGNAALQRVLGVKPTGKKKADRGTVLMGKHEFSFYGDAVPVTKGGRVIAAFEDGRPAFFSAKLGAGELVYTPLVISDRVDQQDDLAGFFRMLVKRLIGPQPLEIADADANAVDTNLMRDGRQYALALRNPTHEGRDARLTFHVPVPPDSILVNMHTGEKRAYRPSLTLRVESGAIDFYAIGPETELALPVITEAAASLCGAAYSTVPENLKLAACAPGSAPGAAPAAGHGKAREKTPGVTYVAVLSDKGRESPNRRARILGDEGVFHALQGQRKLSVEYAYALDAAALGFYDVVVVPNIGPTKCPPGLAKGWEARLRSYVEQGGAALLCHHAVGYQSTCAFPPFPEVGKVGGYAAIREMLVVKEHPVTTGAAYRARFKRFATDPAFQEQFDAVRMKEGDTFRCGYPDYVQIVPGSAGTTLVRSARARGVGGDPAVVAGPFGKGKVVLSGIAIGAKSNTSEGVTQGGERNILLNAVYWLAGD